MHRLNETQLRFRTKVSFFDPMPALANGSLLAQIFFPFPFKLALFERRNHGQSLSSAKKKMYFLNSFFRLDVFGSLCKKKKKKFVQVRTSDFYF